jgi:hypothetical protein
MTLAYTFCEKFDDLASNLRYTRICPPRDGQGKRIFIVSVEKVKNTIVPIENFASLPMTVRSIGRRGAIARPDLLRHIDPEDAQDMCAK